MRHTLCLAATLATSAPAQTKPQITATPNDSWKGIRITSDTGGMLFLVIGTTTVNGRIAICGTGYTQDTNALHQRLVPSIISDLRLRLGPTQLLQQPEDFMLYPSRDEWLRRKGQAGCTLTRIAADPAVLARPLTIEQRTGNATDW